MNYSLKVELLDSDGQPMSDNRLRSLYSSDLHFEPIRRHSAVESDGTVVIKLPESKAALHAKVNVPDFGDVWAMADNCGQGYDPAEATLDFVLEAAKGRLNDVEGIMQTGDFSPECIAHRDACREFLEIAERKSDRAAHFRLKALSHALWAGEYAVVERARQLITERPRREGFLFGSNTFAYSGDTPYAHYFREVLNLGSLPFYLHALESKEGKPRYDRVDNMLEWCERVGITPCGTPLWWAHPAAGIPPWLAGATWQDIQRHCERVVGRSVERYRDSIPIWVVINEAHDKTNGLNLTQEQEVEITRIGCNAARTKNQDATIIVNNCSAFGEYVADGKVNFGPVHDKLFTPLSYLDALMEAEVEFDVVGVQIYFPARDMLSIGKLLDEYARFGKPVHITELGVRSAEVERPAGQESEQLRRTHGDWHQPWSEKVQADWMEWFYTMAYARNEIEAITWWDFRDPAFVQTGGMLHEDETPKEIYFRLRALKEKLLGGFGESRRLLQ